MKYKAYVLSFWTFVIIIRINVPLQLFNCQTLSSTELFITEDELTSLPLVKVVPDGQYTGPKLNTVVRMMRGLLEQKVPLQEFEVRSYFECRSHVN